MAFTTFGDTTVQTVAELPEVGSSAPAFTVVDADVRDVESTDYAGQRVVLNIFPSVGTGVCSQSVRTFNQLAASLENTTVICVSKDLPFALKAFCGAEGIDRVLTTSAFRSSIGDDYGVTMADGPWRGLLARAVVVVDTDGTVIHTQLVPTIGQEPDYDAAVAALG